MTEARDKSDPATPYEQSLRSTPIAVGMCSRSTIRKDHAQEMDSRVPVLTQISSKQGTVSVSRPGRYRR